MGLTVGEGRGGRGLRHAVMPAISPVSHAIAHSRRFGKVFKRIFTRSEIAYLEASMF